jgi:CubicO group peptidase (beta-lactamase class C family)
MLRPLLRTLLLLCLLPPAARAQDGSTGAQPRPLSVSQPYSDSLAAAAVHTFSLDAASGQFVYGEADQRTVDLVVTVYSPEGDVVSTFDGPARGPEPFRFETTTAGRYRIELTPFKEEAGRYTLRLLRAEPVATTPEGRVDQLMAAYGPDTPGGVVAVTQDGQIVFAKGYGLANLEYDVPNTPSTVYHMASVSKQFTAFAVTLLAQQGKLSLDDDVRTHLPELPDFGRTITLRHLLHHTSGLRDQWNLWVMSGGRMDDVIRQEDLFRLIERQRELNFEPGAEYAYSNTGYMLLAEVVARVTGEPFGAWMQAHVFAPLGMTSTQIYDDHERLVPGRAYSYHQDGDGYKKAVLSYANAGATSLFTTAEDLARWLRNFHTTEVGGADVLAQMQELGVLTSGDTLDYALGLTVGDHRGLRSIGHGGADAGFRTMLTYYPEIDAGVVVLGNLGSFNPGQTAAEVAEAFFEESMDAEVDETPRAQEMHEAAPVPEAVLRAYAGEYRIEGAPPVHFVITDGQLATQVEGQPQFGMTALADTLFRIDVPGIEARVSFHRESDGRVERGTLYQNGSTPFHRVEPWRPGTRELTAYAGRYYSPELETFYTVAVEDSQLVARHRRHGDITLAPAEQDVFGGSAWFFSNVRFERDEAGIVSGMRVSNGRVRNLHFEKQE